MKELAPGIVVFDNIFTNSMDYINKIEEQKRLENRQGLEKEYLIMAPA